MAAEQPPPAVQEDQRSEHSYEDQDVMSSSSSSSSQSRGTAGPEAVLRNAPTVVCEDDDPADQEEDNAGKKATAKKGLVQKIMEKLGLNSIILMSMFKASVAPVISISIYQAPAVRNLLTTLGYLVGIISVLCLVVLPRGKFIQNLVLNLLTASIGAAMAILIAWSSVQARLHTSNLEEMAEYIAKNGRAPYNSSQSAVCAVWLVFNIWIANAVRAKFPAFNLPVIIYSIIVNITSTFGPKFPTFASAETFVRELIIAIFMGLAIGTGCSLFIFPISTRKVVMKQMTGVLGLCKKAVSLEKDYLQGLEKDDMFSLEIIETSAGHSNAEKKDEKKEKAPKLTKEQKTAIALRGVISGSKELMGKIYGDIKFAKRDVAWGHLTAKDFGEVFNLIRSFMIPITGIGVIMDIFQKVGRETCWDGTDLNSLGIDTTGQFGKPFDKDDSVKVWQEMMKQLHEPFEILSEALIQGIDHAGILLGFFPTPKELKKASVKTSTNAEADVEDSGGELRPGELGFSKVINEKIDTFKARKGEILRVWAKEKGLSSDGRPENWDKNSTLLFEKRRNDQVQLYVILYLETLMQATGEAVQDFVAFAEEKTRDGSITKKHLIIPTWRRIKKWLIGIFGNDDSTGEDSPDVMERGGNVVFLGHGWKQKKDPEHLPPTTTWEKIGNGLRNFSHFFGSPESVFGFRVACATMTVGVVAFLEQTQQFFIQQRLVWGMIIIAIGMTQTSGQSIFGFFCRTGGTFIAMVNCFIIWYIVDSRTAGVIVFMWLFIFVEFYFFFKFPQFIPGIMICIVTQVLIIGYELQVRSLGIATAEASGQPYYPLYELAPYRLATVAGGCFVAFFWTIFPSPYTDRTWLRKDLSATLYMLANYSSVIHTTMKATLTEDIGDMDIPGSPAHKLFKVRRKLFGKLTLLLPSLQAHANFQKFEPTLGGKFPEELYQDIIQRSQRMMNYFTLMSYILTWAPKDPADESDRAWMHVLAEVMEEAAPVQAQILSILTLLSNSLLSGQSLPPFLPLPEPYEITRHLLSLPTKKSKKPASSSSSPNMLHPENREGQKETQTAEPEAWNLLDARNMEQRGYTEFAVIQVCSTLIISELGGLIKTIGDLVGTVDFSFRVERDDPSVSSLESFRRVGTWASRVSRVSRATAAPVAGPSGGAGRENARAAKEKGKSA